MTSGSTGYDSKAWEYRIDHFYDTQAWIPKNLTHQREQGRRSTRSTSRPRPRS